MLKLFNLKKYFLFFTFIIILSVPALAMGGHGGGMGGCCGGMGGGYSYYPSYATGAGRYSNVLGYYPGGYGNIYSGYPLMNTIGRPVYGGGAYGYPYASSVMPYATQGLYNPYVTGRNLLYEQSYTTYVPGGEVTTTIGEGSTIPVNPFMNYNPYGYGYSYNPYSYGGYGTGYYPGIANTWI